jgi:hypothetical protein
MADTFDAPLTAADESAEQTDVQDDFEARLDCLATELADVLEALRLA